MSQLLKKSKVLSGGFLLATALLAATPAHALVDFGLKGGVGISSQSTSGMPAGYSYSSAFGYLGGVGIDFGLLPVGILVDVLYAHRAIDSTDGATSTKLSYNSLYVPVQADFSLGPIFISGGMYYAMGIGNVSVGGESVSYSTAGMKNSDWGLVLGLGAKVMSFSFEARYNLGLANIADASGVTAKTRSFDVLLGYWF